MDTPSGKANHSAAVENPHAGQSAVLLDIGGDVGALVVWMPTHTIGLEVEIRPRGGTERPGHSHYPHVAVVPRPTAYGRAPTLVYPSVPEGEYELVPLPAGPVAMTATVTGGEVTRAVWPT
jgi:hypothetical protein